MVTITCPWCTEDESFELAATEATEAVFTCPDCGTSVSYVEETAIALELAA